MTRTSLVFAIGVAALAAIAHPATNGIAAGGPVPLSELAPIDAYFGREHLSPLGIRHSVYSLKSDLHRGARRPDAIERDADGVQDALRDWTARFPRDTWLPSTFWNLAVLYEELPGVQARTSAVAVLEIIESHFAASAYGGYARRDLARGIGVRPWPRWAGAPPPLSGAVNDPASLVAAIRGIESEPRPQRSASALVLEDRFLVLSGGGSDPAYARAAWELALAYERLPGQAARTHATRLLALLADRYPNAVFGKWALRDLERGIGERQ